MSVNVELRPIGGLEDFEFLHGLESEPTIMHLYLPNFDGKEKVTPASAEEAFELYQTTKYKKAYIVWADNKPVGNYSVIDNFPHLVKDEPKTAWIALGFISAVHGTNIVRDSYAMFEQRLIEDGYKRIELGVFEFNTRAQRFYEKNGYTKFAEISDFTYWDGKWWKDFRYEKLLEEA
ncbi:GNAT family N-acetyltransferase [Culicoidibacter larvae]|uniref:GNAT family N-acetyltransferase n=1 Tax=Culicoidibacter larvae TaxID=2579976 RepID=A0A5R8QBY3_9FIRM|nr:GNAT family protein [Culicoidibacter larvae]TLG73800.1 GNAT family N-acetyltransferase [Culicoidibacter larvae]